MKTDIIMNADLSNYVLKTDNNKLAEKVITFETENVALKLQIENFNDFKNSFEQNTETKVYWKIRKPRIYL